MLHARACVVHETLHKCSSNTRRNVKPQALPASADASPCLSQIVLRKAKLVSEPKMHNRDPAIIPSRSGRRREKRRLNLNSGGRPLRNARAHVEADRRKLHSAHFSDHRVAAVDCISTACPIASDSETDTGITHVACARLCCP